MGQKGVRITFQCASVVNTTDRYEEVDLKLGAIWNCQEFYKPQVTCSHPPSFLTNWLDMSGHRNFKAPKVILLCSKG